jgi:spermidine/putrescine transport system substrate-binding protein
MIASTRKEASMTSDAVREIPECQPAAGLTRQDVLRRAGVLTLSLGLGSSLASRALAAPAGGSSIDMLSWQGYDLQKAMKPYQAAHDLSFHSTFIGNHDDIQAKVTQDPTGYNLITYYEGYHDLYKQLNILSPLDPKRVPNYRNNFPQFKHKMWWESDGKLWGVPWTWGSWTLNYNPTKMATPKKWTDLLNPNLKGRIAILDDPNGAIVIGARILKLPIPNLTSKQLDAVIALWRKFRENARTISPSPGDLVNLFANGEISAAFGYIAITGLAASQGVTLKHIIPAEGAASYCDAWAIPPEGPDRDAIYGWINHTLTPKVQAYASESLLQGVVQPAALKALKPSLRTLFPYNNIDGWLRRAPLYDLPSDQPGIMQYSDWLSRWAAFKAS